MEFLKGDFDRLVTIELGDKLYDEIYGRCIPNVLCLRGDSGRMLSQFLMFYEDAALYWLDAHPSGGDSVGLVSGQSVIDRELYAILERNHPKDVILVDDIGYPGLEDAVINDVIALYPGWVAQFYGSFPLRFALITKVQE